MIETKIKLNQSQMKRDFDYLHANAETAFNEVKTTEYLAGELDNMGITYERFDQMTGLIATLGSGHPVIGMRADIDALKQHYQGKTGVFHSCGHDAHMTIVLAVARYFQENPQELSGTLKLIFQPAEETVTGAEKVIKSGKLGKLDYLYGLHVCPESEVADHQAEPIILDAATRTLWVTIKGRTAHAGKPQLGANVIDAFSEINQQLRQISLDTAEPYSVTATMFHAGESSNIVPDNGTFALDYRTRTNELMAVLQEKIFAILKGVEKDGIQITIDGNDFSPAAIPSEKAIANMKTAIVNVLGQSGLVEPVVTPGGDDFHFYAYDKVAKNSTMLGLGCGLKPGLHIPAMTFNHDAILAGARMMIDAVRVTK
ncbi:amidohydrolase [Lentilactobacillus diolivorans]|uniref:amidohydrolase n=1 Tax=Lentilactobacillus diolivorans TaxID=179838 RepID=UPI002468BC7D|nr:amidohydrolase [Lentilactobacillus diolivorans]MDH5104601.1 amidohydrolase [Lentilactobacillus diolivorans]